MLTRTIRLPQIIWDLGSFNLLTRSNIRLCADISQSCWKCGTSNSAMFCKNCNSLQKPTKSLNFFNLFDLSPNFDLEVTSLSTGYRKLQSVLHPDKFANASKDERLISEEYSSIVNKAYSTLQHPLSRGLYLLELHGTFLEEGNIQNDPEFLMDIMERNEEVDKSQSEQEIRVVSEKNKKALGALISDLSRAFNAGDLADAKKTLIKMKYFVSVEEKIKTLKLRRGFVE